MTRILAAIGGILKSSKLGILDHNGDVFKKYLFISLIIHVVLITALSISYSRAIKPEMPMGPYDVSLVELEKPKPKQTAVPTPPVKKPEPKPKPPEKKEEEDPPRKEPEQKKEEEQPQEVVKIKEKPKAPPKETAKVKEKPKEEPKQENRPAETKPPENTPEEKSEPAQAPGVSGFQVDSPNFNFNYYLELLRDKIQKNWKPPTGMPSKGEFITAQVKFTVRRDGMIIGVDVEDSSGLAFFDQSALRAVLNSNPAPPLPRAYDEDRLGVHVSFVFGEGTQ